MIGGCVQARFGDAQSTPSDLQTLPQVDHGTGSKHNEKLELSYRKPGGSRLCEYESFSICNVLESDNTTSGGGGTCDTLKVGYT
jgi:hypothetical protein